MSFYDEGDAPRTRASRPTRAAGGGGRAATGGAGADPDTLRTRRLVAAGVAVLLVVLVALLFRSCLHNRAQDALRSYNRAVADLVRRSDAEVSRPFFQALQRGGSPVQLESTINGLVRVAQGQVGQAQDLSPPGDLRAAHRNLLTTLDLRETGLRKVAGKIATAFGRAPGNASGEAVTAIAADMQFFLASDVLFDARVAPFLRERLNEEGLGGQERADTRFLPSLGWLSPQSVGDQLGRAASDTGTGGRRTGKPAPGRHGHALTSVAVGSTTLQPGQAVNRIPAGARLSFTVSFTNQGDNTERDVPVRVRISGGGTQTISASRRVPTTEAGATAEAQVPLADTPPIGQPVEVQVTVERVPGEQLTDNNTQTYTVIFER